MKTLNVVSKKAVAMVDIEVLNPFAGSIDVVKIAEVYQKAFRSDPWNEGYLCPVCKDIIADDGYLKAYCKRCQDSDGRLVRLIEYWPISKILTDFYQEMLKPEAECLIMKHKNDVIAFIWGYEVKSDKSIDKYLEAPGLHRLIKGDFLYLDECAVAPEWQGGGCGKALVAFFLRKAKKSKKSVLLRTMKGGVMHRIIEKFGGEIVQEISRGRIIMKIVV